MLSAHSVSEWIASLKQGDLDSIQKLWDRFRERLAEAAKRKLAESRRALDDEDDVIQSVLVEIWEGSRCGLFDDVRNRDELWWTLLRITNARVVDSVRRECAIKRGGCQPFITFQEVITTDTSDAFVDELENSTIAMIDTLRNPTLQKIAQLRIMGYSVTQISDHLSIPKRSTERKLELIRNKLSKELERVEA
jgi:DNA-directed RNA polymerase specialized sigma24 family protein